MASFAATAVVAVAFLVVTGGTALAQGTAPVQGVHKQYQAAGPNTAPPAKRQTKPKMTKEQRRKLESDAFWIDRMRAQEKKNREKQYW